MKITKSQITHYALITALFIAGCFQVSYIYNATGETLAVIYFSACWGMLIGLVSVIPMIKSGAMKIIWPGSSQ